MEVKDWLSNGFAFCALVISVITYCWSKNQFKQAEYYNIDQRMLDWATNYISRGTLIYTHKASETLEERNDALRALARELIFEQMKARLILFEREKDKSVKSRIREDHDILRIMQEWLDYVSKESEKTIFDNDSEFALRMGAFYGAFTAEILKLSNSLRQI
jgi:hypothetical protein